jgi:hypothetical protein
MIKSLLDLFADNPEARKLVDKWARENIRIARSELGVVLPNEWNALPEQDKKDALWAVKFGVMEQLVKSGAINVSLIPSGSDAYVLLRAEAYILKHPEGKGLGSE